MRAAKIIREQPGYNGKGIYQVSRSKTGGYRLYKLVAGTWMDASLADCRKLKKYVNKIGEV